MISPVYSFYLLCVGELCVVVTGFTSIPAATALQILILIAIFRDLVFSNNAYRHIAFSAFFTIATGLFAGFALLIRHTALSLFLLLVIAVFTIIYLIFIEYRFEQKVGGFT